jgi:hypothetical protein
MEKMKKRAFIHAHLQQLRLFNGGVIRQAHVAAEAQGRGDEGERDACAAGRALGDEAAGLRC